MNHDFFEDYELTFNIDTDTITNKFSYVIEFEKGKMIIKSFDKNDDFIEDTFFNSYSTLDKSNTLPFSLVVHKFGDIESRLNSGEKANFSARRPTLSSPMNDTIS